VNFFSGEYITHSPKKIGSKNGQDLFLENTLFHPENRTQKLLRPFFWRTHFLVKFADFRTKIAIYYFFCQYSDIFLKSSEF